MPSSTLYQRRINSLRYRRSRRDIAIDNLGGACSWCGLTAKSILQIDHVLNDGFAERHKEAATQRAAKGDVSGLQLLCANCHMEKTFGATRPTWNI